MMRGKIVPISINLSRASLYFESVVKRYHDIARRIGIYTHLVPIEITESAAVDNDEIKVLRIDSMAKDFRFWWMILAQAIHHLLPSI